MPLHRPASPQKRGVGHRRSQEVTAPLIFINIGVRAAIPMWEGLADTTTTQLLDLKGSCPTPYILVAGCHRTSQMFQPLRQLPL
jgi:hypothetical protein